MRVRIEKETEKKNGGDDRKTVILIKIEMASHDVVVRQNSISLLILTVSL